MISKCLIFFFKLLMLTSVLRTFVKKAKDRHFALETTIFDFLKVQ